MITIGVNKSNSGSGTAATVIEKTYAELLAMRNASELVTGQKYLMTDFATIYDQPDLDSDGNPKEIVATKTATEEPLVLTAISNGDFDTVVCSKAFPEDSIRYNILFDTTEAMEAPAKGRIIERIDERGNRADYDFRGVVFKRYETAVGSGIFTERNDNGNAFQEFTTFSTIDFCANNYLPDLSSIYVDFGEAFLLPNILFIGYNWLNKITGFVSNVDIINCQELSFDYAYNTTLSGCGRIKCQTINNTTAHSCNSLIIEGFNSCTASDSYNINVKGLSSSNIVNVTNMFSNDEIAGVDFEALAMALSSTKQVITNTAGEYFAINYNAENVPQFLPLNP